MKTDSKKGLIKLARVEGFLNGEEVYNEECSQQDVDMHITRAFACWGNIDELGEVLVEVTDDDGYVWTPV